MLRRLSLFSFFPYTTLFRSRPGRLLPRLRSDPRLRLRSGDRAVRGPGRGDLPFGGLPRIRLLHDLAPGLGRGRGGSCQLRVRPELVTVAWTPTTVCTSITRCVI